jgi:hypothetical protein
VTAARGIAAALVLAAVFAVIVVSVVDARGPLDAAVTRSFERVAAGADGVPLGCEKTSYDYYDCGLRVSRRGTPVVTFTYRLLLGDGGCWVTLSEPIPPRPAPPQLQGCIAG